MGMLTSVSETQKQLEKLDPSDDKYRLLLRELLSHQDLKPHIHGLDGPGLEGFVELLDKALSCIPVTDDLFRKALRRLQSVCANREVLPRSHVIPSGKLSNMGGVLAAGGVADVHKAEFGGRKVCVKVLRLYRQDTLGVAKKTFYREVVAWKRLRHPNIVPFVGVPTKIPPFEIVCEWIENGKLTEYIRKNPEVDRVDLLWDVADGLHYLHSCNIIHGDLKGSNVLIDRHGRARLTDFGLTSIIPGDTSIVSPQDPNMATTMTCAAPEILGGGPVSKEGDVFTFAMVAVETFTGRPPFITTYQAAIFDIITGKHPGRPGTLHHEGLWEVMNRCWIRQPKQRPTVLKLLEFFRESFPRDRDTSEAQPLPNAPSTWTLTPAEREMDGNPKPLPDPPGQGAVDGNLPISQRPSTGDAQAIEREPQGKPGRSVQGSTGGSEKPLPQPGVKPSRFKQAVQKLKKIMKPSPQ